MLVRLCFGVLVSNSLCGGASLGGSRSLSKILDLASQRALVTGEWYIPGHKAIGLRVLGLRVSLTREELLSKGVAKVENTEMVLGDEELKSMIWELEFSNL